jgi:formylglycine-generating enzyme required for sulfatase activity
MHKALLRYVVSLAAVTLSAVSGAADYRAIPGGTLRTVLPPDGKQAPALVSAFRLRTTPVTNAEFLSFVRTHPQWRRDKVPSLFAEGRYLEHWSGPLELGATALPQQPVTQVSWYAARAFCASESARLPTWHEWELAAAADSKRRDARDDAAWRSRILEWYARPSNEALPAVGQGEANLWGVHNLHGLVWEWVDDFVSLMVSGDNREQGDPDLLRFCGAGALSVNDRENYAVLMRVAMLSALKARDTTQNLGFRCAMAGMGEAGPGAGQ